MAKIFITVVVLYALFVAICLFRLNLSKRRQKDIVGKGSSIHEAEVLKTDIVGKSKFGKRASTPLNTAQIISDYVSSLIKINRLISFNLLHLSTMSGDD